MDEIWGFIAKKERNVKPEDGDDVGSIWTFCVIDADSKLVPAFRCGERDQTNANTAYAWAHETDDPANPVRHVTVLQIPPAVSPITAVRAAIVQELKELRANADLEAEA